MSAFFASIFAWLTSTGWGMATIVGFVLMLIAKFAPREKLWIAFKPSSDVVAILINTFLLKWLGKKTAIKVEEGLFCTIFYIGRKWFENCEAKLLSDNIDEPIKIIKTESLVKPKEPKEPRGGTY
jgi:hypothetical protein